MFFRKVFICLLLLTVSIVSAAQDDPCPAFVQAALQAVALSCDQLGRNQACYGYNRVDVNFWEAHDDQVFSVPSDRVSVAELQQIATAPLDMDQGLWGVAVLSVQADIPETLPGQAVTMLLMGDAQITNAVSPADTAPVVNPISAVVQSGGNLRSMPSTTSNIVGSVSVGDGVSIIGLTEAGEWYEIAREDNSHAWIWNQLVDVSPADLDTLPVTDGTITQQYGPMQAYLFSSTPNNSRGCQEAPDALVVQSPENITVTLHVNGLEVHLGSTIIFTIAALEDGTSVLVGTLVEGYSQVVYQAFTTTLEQPGQSFAVTLNQEGLVDENSTLVDISTDTAVQSAVRFGCESVRDNPLLPTPPASCDFPFDFNVTIPVADEGNLGDVGANDPCVLAADRLANLRGGPGTSYPWNGQLLEGQRAAPNGYADGTDGYRWYRLDNDLWVRSDLVNQAGACGALPAVATPQPPEPPPPPSTGSNGRYYELSQGCPDMSDVRAGQTVMFQDGMGRWPTPAEKEAALAGHYAVITVDGAPLSVYYEGTTLHVGDGAPDGYGERARANWVAVSGTHTVSAYWTNAGNTVSCVFTIP